MRIWTHAAGYAALIVVLSAGAAQSLSGTDTVFTDDIAPGAVTKTDIKAGSVTGGKVLDGSLTGADLAAGSIGFSQVGATWTDPVRVTLYGDSVDVVNAPCPSGQRAISGAATSGSFDATMTGSRPYDDGWQALFRNWAASTASIEVQALCIPK